MTATVSASESRRRGALVGALLTTVGVLAGCSPSLEAPPEAPTFHVDTQASEVWVRGPAANADRAEALRGRIAGALFEMMQDRPDLDRAPPARFSAKIDYDIESWPTAPCLFFLSLVGCPLALWTFDVDLVLESNGQVYRGSATHTAPASFYYNNNGLDGAAIATEKALADAWSGADRADRAQAPPTQEGGP